MLCTLCQNYLIFYNMQLCGFQCIKGYSICILVIFPCIFFNYCDYHVNHREFQMPNEFRHKYFVSQLVHITRNGLNTKCSLHFSTYFKFLVILVNFPLTGNDNHSQPKSWYFIISNASHSIHLFLAQWRHISSESAVITVFKLLLELH